MCPSRLRLPSWKNRELARATSAFACTGSHLERHRRTSCPIKHPIRSWLSGAHAKFESAHMALRCTSRSGVSANKNTASIAPAQPSESRLWSFCATLPMTRGANVRTIALLDAHIRTIGATPRLRSRSAVSVLSIRVRLANASAAFA